jgi:purine-binding chemotaxis protein CheW
MSTKNFASSDGKLLVFAIAGHYCAVPVEAVQEIVPMATLSCVPGQPSLLEGFLNLRGTAIPILRLSRLFDFPAAEPGLHTPLIILRGPPHPAGLLVDAVVEIASTDRGGGLPIQEHSCFNDCVQAQVEVGARVVQVLSPERILLEKERQCVAELQAQAQRRLDELEARPA